MKFVHDLQSAKVPPVVLDIDPRPVYYVGPATRDHPMSQMRAQLLGKVQFNDQKTKWSRITLHFVGKAGLNIKAKTSTLPSDVVNSQIDLHDSVKSTTHLETVVTLCDVEKELIYNHDKEIAFNFYLPPYLPPSLTTEHSFVEYTLKLVCSSSGPFTKKQKIETPVKVCRHYLPGPNALIPTIEYNGAQEWFEWSAEVPKATAIDAGEIVVAFRFSVDKELIEVEKTELYIEELETYRFSTKSGVHNLPSIVTRFPSTISPVTSNSFETHFIRITIPNAKSNELSIRTHHFDPFLDISHRLKLTIHFSESSMEAKPITLEFPIIITDFPPHTLADYFDDHFSLIQMTTDNERFTADLPHDSFDGQTIANELSVNDMDLPEYTPRYEGNPT